MFYSARGTGKAFTIMDTTGKKKKRASFILITLNRADYLDRILTNVREFLTSDDELIVMDGGSTDNTREVIQKHKDIITLFESERDFGSAHALNKGILNSTGRFIMNLSDDDYFYADGVNKAIAVMEKNPEIDALVCGGEYYSQDFVNGEIKLLGYQYLSESKKLVSDVGNIFNNVAAGFLILNRRIIARVGLFDSIVQASDTEYMSRLILSKANFKYLNVKMFRLTFQQDSSARNNWQEAKKDRIIIAMRHGNWDEIMKHSLAEIGLALRLNDYPLGDWMLDLLWFKSLFRRYKKLRMFFLKAYLLGIHLICVVLRQIKKSPFIYTKVKQHIQKPESPVEPNWDGSLR